MSQVLAFKSFPEVKTLVAFNGLIGYLGDHIPGLATRLPILQDAVTQDKFEMTESCQQAVKEIQMLCLKAERISILGRAKITGPEGSFENHDYDRWESVRSWRSDTPRYEFGRCETSRLSCEEVDGSSVKLYDS